MGWYPYAHVRRDRLLFANRQRGIFNLHVGCANTQGTSVILSPDPQGQCRYTAKASVKLPLYFAILVVDGEIFMMPYTSMFTRLLLLLMYHILFME